MAKECAFHDHSKLAEIEQMLLTDEMNEFQAARTLNTVPDQILYHMSHCLSKSSIMETFGDPLQKMMIIAHRILYKCEKMLDKGKTKSEEGERLVNMVRASADILSKLQGMGYSFKPISEVKMDQYRADYEEFIVFIARANFCKDCREEIDQWLEEQEGEEDRKKLG